MGIKVVSWNIDKRRKAWEELLDMDADVGLLQEVGVVPRWVPGRPGVGIGLREHWDSHTWLAGDKLYDRWSMVVKLSDRVEVQWFKQVAPIAEPGGDDFPVSGIGTVAAARVVPRKGQPFVVVSMYGRWIRWHPHRQKQLEGGLSGRGGTPHHLRPVRPSSVPTIRQATGFWRLAT